MTITSMSMFDVRDSTEAWSDMIPVG
ncbi:Bgt-50547 [Blumeria graminis f. sp. tritici]|uniref:Bgt-50547 n=1 Tax=Blumeria graminis f. sp. tritici TaxID=62690 RepID=A0A9X9QC90_BLUGR|nr:Bgt-50547 [Blumeria graminis f. sp. tritici]